MGGTISGYTGSGLVLTSAGGHTASPVSGAGAFTLSGTYSSGAAYSVTVTTQPTAPAQFCTVTGGTGTVTANVTTIGVSCLNVGKYVFVANPNDSTGSVAAFTINPTTGVLTQVTGSPYAVPGGDLNPTGLAVDPSGAFLYVANSGSADVSTYAVATGGLLTPDVIAPTPTGTGTNQPFSLAIDPTGTLAPYLYVGSNDNPNSTIETFSIAGGVLTQVGAATLTGDEPFSLAVDSTDGFLYSANVFTPSVTGYSIAPATGQLTVLGTSPFGSLAAPYAVAAYPTGQYVYVTDMGADPATAAGSINEYSYDNTGTLTFVQSKPVGIGPQGIAIDPAGKFLYVTNTNDGTVSAFTIDSTTGNLTAVAGSPFTSGPAIVTPDEPSAAAVDPSGQFLYVANSDTENVSAFTINATTGVLTPVAGSPFACTLGGEGPAAIAIE